LRHRIKNTYVPGSKRCHVDLSIAHHFTADVAGQFHDSGSYLLHLTHEALRGSGAKRSMVGDKVVVGIAQSGLIPCREVVAVRKGVRGSVGEREVCSAR
jgi:hypothetical protein